MTERSQLRLFRTSQDPSPAAGVAEAFDAARLTQARRLAGLTKAALAQQVGVSGAAASQWEARTSPPRPDHLARLAEVLEVPVEFFAVGRPYAQLDGSAAHFRSLRSTKAAQRAKAVAFVEQMWELTYALEKHVQLPPVDLPGFLPDDTDHLPDTPAAAARVLRARWGLGTGPIPHLVRTMETHGIVTTMVRFAGADTATIDAFSTSRMPRPLIVLTPDRGNDVYWHRFTAAHELGHLVLHRDAAPADPEQEQQADAFAAEFLTPADRIRDQLPTRVDFTALEQLSRAWGVSLKSLIYRCRELGTISDASARRAYQRLNQLYELGIIGQDPVANYPGEVPSLLHKAFELAESNGTLTMTGLARELRWRLPRLRLLLGHPDERPVLRLV
ncbi:XRE family transcriptional regulator [Nocardia sp. NPDC023852]|uniref:helix-turn-helix domain-containing protein n=1 Tax=Nocardia sp. NPDC023852 TaxID=3154697 RepID=UPI0033F34166